MLPRLLMDMYLNQREEKLLPKHVAVNSRVSESALEGPASLVYYTGCPDLFTMDSDKQC
jgi:hypothetical protein